MVCFSLRSSQPQANQPACPQQHSPHAGLQSIMAYSCLGLLAGCGLGGLAISLVHIIILLILIVQWRIQGGGVQGVRTAPLLGHDVGFLTLGPKLDPPPFVNVQEWGCFSNFLRSDDVTRTMSKGGGACEKSCIRAWTPPFQKSWIRACSTKQ